MEESNNSIATTTKENSEAHQTQPGTEGVLPDYLSLLDEAYRRAEKDFGTSHERGERGVAIGPTEGDFKHTVRALQNARRIRNVLAGGDGSVKIALMTSHNHIRILHSCSDPNVTTQIEQAQPPDREQLSEGCRLWANGTLLDDVIATIDDEYKGNDNHTNLDQGSSFFMLKNMASYRHAPYTTTLFLDTDAYPCPGFEKLFALVEEPDNKIWQIPVTAEADVAIGLEQYPYEPTGFASHFVPGDPAILRDFFTFTFRNDGVVLFHFHRKVAHVFAHFIPLVSEYVYNHVGNETVKVINDQTPFNIALYLSHRLVPDFLETQIPMHASCRSYPGKDYAGTDGFWNGMLPLQSDGKYCSECQCSPCLISHFTDLLILKVNGQNGW